MRVSIVVSILFVTALCSVEENLYGDAPIGNLTQALQREKRFFGLFGIGAALIGAKIVACRKNDHFCSNNLVWGPNLFACEGRGSGHLRTLSLYRRTVQCGPISALEFIESGRLCLSLVWPQTNLI